MSPKMTHAFFWKWQNADDGQVIPSFLTLYNVGLDSRFGEELVQSVSLLLGQGHCLAASEETDPLTVDHCCGGQAAYNISTIYSLESAGDDERNSAVGHGSDLWGTFFASVKWFQQSLVQFYEEISCFFFSIFRPIFHPFWGEFLQSVSDSCDPQILIIFLLSLEMRN